MASNAHRVYNERFNEIRPDQIVDGYVQMAQDRQAAGWRPYLTTLMYRNIPGNRERRIGQMRDEGYRVYRRFLTRLVRRPRSGVNRDDLPILILLPDLPVGKSNAPLKRVKINDGLHLGGVLLVPPRSRLRVPADEHFRTNRELYLRASVEEIETRGNAGLSRVPTYLSEIDVRSTDQPIETLVSYALKSLPRQRFTSDDIIIFPKAVSELE